MLGFFGSSWLISSSTRPRSRVAVALRPRHSPTLAGQRVAFCGLDSPTVCSTRKHRLGSQPLATGARLFASSGSMSRCVAELPVFDGACAAASRRSWLRSSCRCRLILRTRPGAAFFDAFQIGRASVSVSWFRRQPRVNAPFYVGHVAVFKTAQHMAMAVLFRGC